MVTCPFCWGMCNINEIQLEKIETDSQDFFFCKKCKRLFDLNEIDKDTLEDTWSEDFLSDLQIKMDALCTVDESEDKK